MKMWLRLLALLMVVCMMLGCLAACGEDDSKKRDDDDDEERTHEEEDEEEEDGDYPDGFMTKDFTLNALTFQVPADADVEAHDVDYAYYSCDEYELIVASGTLDGTAYSDDEMAVFYMGMMEDEYESSQICEDGDSGVAYVQSVVTDGLYEICSFYYNEEYDYGWTICIYYEDRTQESLLITCAVSGVIDEDYDIGSLLGGNEPEEPVESDNEFYDVIVYAPEDWGQIRIWAWQDGGDNLFASWPGEAMEYTGEYYMMGIPVWADCIVINGMNGDIQTEDIYVGTWDAVWVVISADGSYYEVYFEEPTQQELEDMGY